jgi:malonyl-CoA O-methyltransferase
MTLEYQAIADSFSAAADRYEDHAVLQKEVLNRLLERLDDEARLQADPPRRILDLGCGTGWAVPRLRQQFPEAEIHALDFSPAMIARVPAVPGCQARVGDAHDLPYAEDSFDLVFSNLMLQWTNEEQVLQEVRRVLKPGGILLASSLGFSTLHELRHSWQAVDDKPHVNAFTDMRQVADGMLRLGYSQVVANSETIVLTYATVVDLMRDLKAIGAHNVDEDRPRSLMSRTALRKLEAAYEKFREQNVLPATYEVNYFRGVMADKPRKDIPSRLQV